MNTSLRLAAVAVVSLLLGASVSYFFSSNKSAQDSAVAAEKAPLYWVAPMDANYRRDQPGKSPMGMDLVPVYQEAEADDPGAVRISPQVVNNLGVRTARVEKRVLNSEILTVGYVQYDQDQLVHIHPRVAGWVEQLFVKAAGDPVQKGEPLYALYSPQLVNAQEEFLMATSRDDARLEAAAVSRLQALHIDDLFISQLRASRKVKQRVLFRAPQTGVVDNLNIREGFYVEPGTTMMSIGTLAEVWVLAEVFERQANLVKLGQPVKMRLDYMPGRVWSGQVDYVYPTLDPETRTLRVRLRFSNNDKVLRPNMFAQVQIHIAADAPGIVVPRAAVIRTGHQDRVVLALGDGRFKSVEVVIKRWQENFAEVSEGLKEGDLVVTSAQFLIDSESSKTSDFLRYDNSPEPPASVSTRAVIDTVMAGMGMVKLTHQPIPEWDWPEMTMMFILADGIDIESLSAGMKVNIEIRKRDDDYEIIELSEVAEVAP